jgi:5-methylcytosine-specific restriction endonuclease McrA
MIPDKLSLTVEHVRKGVETNQSSYKQVLRRDICSYCGMPALRPQTIDHIVPSSCGGSQSITNLTASCARCNVAKGSASLLGFLLAKNT